MALLRTSGAWRYEIATDDRGYSEVMLDIQMTLPRLERLCPAVLHFYFLWWYWEQGGWRSHNRRETPRDTKLEKNAGNAAGGWRFRKLQKLWRGRPGGLRKAIRLFSML